MRSLSLHLSFSECPNAAAPPVAQRTSTLSPDDIPKGAHIPLAPSRHHYPAPPHATSCVSSPANGPTEAREGGHPRSSSSTPSSPLIPTGSWSSSANPRPRRPPHPARQARPPPPPSLRRSPHLQRPSGLLRERSHRRPSPAPHAAAIRPLQAAMEAMEGARRTHSSSGRDWILRTRRLPLS